MQSSSIDFLCSQGFDFNKAFGKGIPFLKRREAERLCKTLTDKKTRMDEEAKNTGNSSDKSLFKYKEIFLYTQLFKLPNKSLFVYI